MSRFDTQSSHLIRSYRKFAGNRAAMVGLYVLIITFLVAFFGALIRPDRSPFANEQNLTIARMPPFSSIQFFKVQKNRPIPYSSWWQMFFQGGEENHHDRIPMERLELQGNRVKLKVWSTSKVEEHRYYSLIDVFFAVGDETVAAFAATQADAFEFEDLYGDQHRTSKKELQARVMDECVRKRYFLLGTDPSGRDVLSRLMAGSVASIVVGLVSVIIALILGLTIGVAAGYYGGWIDRLLSWVVNVFWSVPAILLVISVALVLGKGMLALVIGIGLILWVEMAQVVRGEVISLREREFVKAARLMGLSHWQIIRSHIVPNALGPVAILSASNFADAILMEAGLSFLGVGIQPPEPSWGNMIRESYGYIITDGAYLAIVPGIAIVGLVLAFVVVSQGLKRALDVHRAGVEVTGN